jgi:hypothetical protein
LEGGKIVINAGEILIEVFSGRLCLFHCLAVCPDPSA